MKKRKDITIGDYTIKATSDDWELRRSESTQVIGSAKHSAARCRGQIFDATDGSFGKRGRR
jgi:hypothetical protein